MNFKEMKTWNPTSSSVWKEIVSRWGEDVYADETQRAEKMVVLKAEWDAAQYARTRATAYPSIADQLDQIYHEGIDAWKTTIAAVKAEYPKP